MRVLITGICGFVGSRIALGLKRRADPEIIGIDSLVRRGSETSQPLLTGCGISVRHGDVRCASDFEDLGACDWVVDAAANPSVLAGVDGRASSRQVVEHNLVGTINILEFCRRHGAGLVLLSTSRVYSVAALNALPLRVEANRFVPDERADWPSGASPAGLQESFSTAAPVSLYGATKLASEALALEYGAGFGFPVVVNRCGVIAGAGQFGTAEQGIFSYWIGAWAAGRPLRYIGFDGSGRQVRDAMHPDDLTALVDAQMRAAGDAAGVWTVGGGPSNAMSLAEVSSWCAERLGVRDVDPQPAARRWDAPWIVMDSRRANARFDWRPVIGVETILDEIADHYARHPEWLNLSQPA